MARRRTFREPPKPFDGAWSSIDTLEQAVIFRTVEAPFTVKDVTRAFWSDDMCDKLSAAYHHVNDSDKSNWHEQVLVPMAGGTAGMCLFSLKLSAVPMLRPKQGTCTPTTDRARPIVKTVNEIYAQHLEFEKVREVVRWLNSYATAGAARHYCPWLCSLLPSDHPVNQAGGAIYREPQGSMTGIIPVMRECGAIVAAALMCSHDYTPRTGFSVAFGGRRDTGLMASEDYTSNVFGIL